MNKHMPDFTEALASARHSLVIFLSADRCDRVWIFSDPGRKWLCDAYVQVATELGLKPFLMLLPGDKYSEEDLQPVARILETLGDRDMVLSVFSDGIARDLPFFRIFPNLRSPQNFKGISGVVRQRYPVDALLQHLLTPVDSVSAVIKDREQLSGRKLRITAPGGTDISLQVMDPFVLPCQVSGENRHAFLPPAEITFGVVQGSAQGKLVVDVTVGEFGTPSAGLVDPLGLVDEPVHIRVEDGYATEITGGDIAARLKRCFEPYGKADRLVIELGFGLSQGQPTGMIGADECLQTTCHFGIGDDFFYGGTNPANTHLDWVIKNPKVEIIG